MSHHKNQVSFFTKLKVLVSLITLGYFVWKRWAAILRFAESAKETWERDVRPALQEVEQKAADLEERLEPDVRRIAKRIERQVVKVKNQLESSASRTSPFQLNDRQETIYGQIKSVGQATMVQLAKQVSGVTDRTLRRDLTKLGKLGLVEQVGRTKDSFYRLRK